MAEESRPEAKAQTPRFPLSYRHESKSAVVYILELFFNRWMIICGIFFSAIFWSYVALVQTPDTYQATAQVLIRRGKIQAIQDVPILRQEEEVGSEIDILHSIAVINETVDQLLKRVSNSAMADATEQPLIFGLYRPDRPHNALTAADLPTVDPAQLFKILKKGTRIQKFGESNVIEVTLVSVSPVFATECVNTLIDVYEKFNLTMDHLPGQAAFYAQGIKEVDEEINALQSKMAEYMTQQRIVAPKKERELLALRRHTLTAELDALYVKKVALKKDLEALADPKTRLAAAYLRQDSAISWLRQGLFDRQKELAELKSRLTMDNPLVVAKLEEMQELKRTIDLEEQIAVLQQQHRYAQLVEQEKQLLARIQEVEIELSRFPTLEAQLDRFDRDITQRTIKRADMVEQMFKSATLERSDVTLNKVKVLGYAVVPSYPREVRKGFKFAVAVVLSLVFAFLAAVFVEGMDHTLRRREEIEGQLHVPHLASLSTHYR